MAKFSDFALDPSISYLARFSSLGSDGKSEAFASKTRSLASEHWTICSVRVSIGRSPYSLGKLTEWKHYEYG
jgi:hypothetical protein